jgi:hypothetical protein
MVFSLLLSACEIEFTPDVVPLEIGEAPPGSFIDQVPEAEAQPELAFTSAEAMALCGSDLAWGDGAMGACLAPGGDYYYIWTNPNDVYFVPVNASDSDQIGFVQAVIARGDDMAELETGARDAGWEVAGLFITVLGFAPACGLAPPVGCILDGAGILVTGGLVANTGIDFVADLESFQSHSRQAEYYLCSMRGRSDQQCRDDAGMIPSDLEGIQ